jgi:anti-sigma B factor antagonist
MAVARSPSRDEVSREAGPPLVVWREGTRTVVSLRGEQDMSTSADLVEALAAAGAAGHGDVVVDLSDVQFMDSAIITVLSRGQDALRLQARALMLRSPSRFAGRLLAMCALVAPRDGLNG